MVRAMIVRLLIENPTRYMTPKVPTSETGTTMLGMIVARMFRRNRKITITTSAIDSPSSNSTSCTEARIVVVRSASTVTCSAPGRPACSCGSSASVRLTVWMTLLPGWRWTLRITAGVVLPLMLAHAASLVFSAASITWPTSVRRIAEPFL